MAMSGWSTTSTIGMSSPWIERGKGGAGGIGDHIHKQQVQVGLADSVQRGVGALGIVHQPEIDHPDPIGLHPLDEPRLLGVHLLEQARELGPVAVVADAQHAHFGI